MPTMDFMGKQIEVDDDGYLFGNKHLFTDIMLKPFSIRDVMGSVQYALGAVRQKGIKCLECGNAEHAR